MLLRTHVFFALLIAIILILNIHLTPINKLIFLAIILVASRLPDIDETRSKIGKRTKPVSSIINFIFDHRGFFHSLTIIILSIIGLLTIKTPHFIILAVAIGYFSHLFLDAFTKSGIPILWPIKTRLKGFVKTGSFLEIIFFWIVILLIFVLIIKNFTTLKDTVVSTLRSIF